MKRIDWSQLDQAARSAALARPEQSRSANTRAAVSRIIERVREDGDTALFELTKQLDRCDLASLRVSEEEFIAAEAALSEALKSAISEALGRIDVFHRACAVTTTRVETAPGVVCERILRPIESVGLYVPAGGAPLPSTALMLGVPSRIAACPEITLCTPPRADGRCDEAVLYAARLCGIERVFKLGGAQAIAAMAYGTNTIPRCDKLFGPGNVWVTEAKLQVAADPQGAAIDMPAGPSEVLVLTDEFADPRFVAADLLAQAEHGVDSQVILVSTSGALLDAVDVELDIQCARMSRSTIAMRALENSRSIRVNSLALGVEVSNAYAPEHLIINTKNPRDLLAAVNSAGSIFLGAWTPESVGDYCSGTNHVLPTYGYARAWSGLSVASFQKQMTVQELSPEGLRAIGPCTMTLAAAEQLDAHANAVRVRLDVLENQS